MDRTSLDYGSVFASSAMKRVIGKIEKIAPYDAPVLIAGETGTGKEIIADILQKLSLRRENPYVKVNCATMPKDLTESLFFGAVKGAYTGAVCNREGYFKQADKGTIFLDELPEMDYSLQSKLLRVLQDKSFRPVGGAHEEKSDFRIIWATNLPIAEAIERQKLREDLYYRISEVEILIPPLRERQEDIAPLAYFFLHEANQQYKKRVNGFTRRCLEKFLGCGWPGNVRQLRSVVRSAVLLSENGQISEEEIEISFQKNALKLGKLKAGERELVLYTLKETNGNKMEAAKTLGIGRQTLYNKIADYGLDKEFRFASIAGRPANGKMPRAKMTAEEILHGRGHLEFDFIATKSEYDCLVSGVVEAFMECRGDPQTTARTLGTNVRHLKNIVKVFGIDDIVREAFGSELGLNGAPPQRYLPAPRKG